MAKILARNGLRDSAEAVLVEYGAGPRDRPWFAYDEAQVRLMLGDREAALDLVEMYVRIAPDRRSYLASDWAFEALWDDPRFVEITSGGETEAGAAEADESVGESGS